MNLLPRRYYLDDFFDDFLEERPYNTKCDIYEKDNKYHVIMDIPGFDKKDISVDCSDGYLTIEAEKETKDNEKEKNYIRRERTYGKIKRQFYVGNVDVNKATAEFKDGTLKITIPRLDEKENKKMITID